MSQFRGDLALNVKDGAVAIQHYKRAIDRLKAAGGWEAGAAEEAVADPGATQLVLRTRQLESPRPQYAFLRLPEPGTLLYGLAGHALSKTIGTVAVSSLQQLKDVMPNDHTVYTRLADIYFRQGLLSQALGN